MIVSIEYELESYDVLHAQDDKSVAKAAEARDRSRRRCRRCVERVSPEEHYPPLRSIV